MEDCLVTVIMMNASVWHLIETDIRFVDPQQYGNFYKVLTDIWLKLKCHNYNIHFEVRILYLP